MHPTGRCPRMYVHDGVKANRDWHMITDFLRESREVDLWLGLRFDPAYSARSKIYGTSLSDAQPRVCSNILRDDVKSSRLRLRRKLRSRHHRRNLACRLPSLRTSACCAVHQPDSLLPCACPRLVTTEIEEADTQSHTSGRVRIRWLGFLFKTKAQSHRERYDRGGILR